MPFRFCDNLLVFQSLHGFGNHKISIVNFFKSKESHHYNNGNKKNFLLFFSFFFLVMIFILAGQKVNSVISVTLCRLSHSIVTPDTYVKAFSSTESFIFTFYITINHKGFFFFCLFVGLIHCLNQNYIMKKYHLLRQECVRHLDNQRKHLHKIC